MRVQYGQVFSTVEEMTDEEKGIINFQLTGVDGVCLFDGKAIHTGLLDRIKAASVTVDVVGRNDQPVSRSVVVEDTVLEGIKLRDYQSLVIRKSILCERGIVSVATGGGKTAIAAATIKKLNQLGFIKVTVLVPTGYLMQQTVKEYQAFGVESVSGVGYGSKFNKHSDVQVFVAKSAASALAKGGAATKHIEESDVLVMDESHHASADTWAAVCMHTKARFRFAYTATAFEDPNCVDLTAKDLLLIGLTGRPIVTIKSKDLRDRGYLATPYTCMIPIRSRPVVGIWHPSIVYKVGIVSNKSRNSAIVTLTHSLYKGINRTLLFVIYKNHGIKLSEVLSKDLGCEVLCVQGASVTYQYTPSGSRKTRNWSIEQIGDYVRENNQAILICTPAFDEGIDLPQVNCLVMAAGQKKYRRYVQRSGRGMRPKEGDNKVYVFDFYDTNHIYLEKHSEYRLETYRNEEFEFVSSLEEMSTLLGCELTVKGIDYDFGDQQEQW